MKKSIIKRRKRVVPATQEQSPNSSHLASFSVSISPDPQHSESRDLRNDQQDPQITNSNDSMNLDLRLRNQEADHPTPWEPAPIGVDFTGYQIDQQRRVSTHVQQQQHLHLPGSHDPSMAVSPSESQATLSPFPPNNSRKRSFSISEHENPSPPLTENVRSNRLNSISSLLNPPQQHQPFVDEMPIDPSLSGIGQPTNRHVQLPQPQPYHHPRPRDMRSTSAGNIEQNDWAAQRKAQLRSEAEEMREMLRAKERELEELDGEG